ncbi:MAG: DNA-deoxyinosine glycosylase [Methylomonas sp.]|jgi:hypoxanthine-DNA glycosylase
MTAIYSFPPLVDDHARVLVLGSMPGKASLAAAEYYAHPRNLFWPIMGELFGAYPQLSYAERTRILTDKGLAVWDVLRSCRRDGSLDAAIDKASMISNDFAGFFQRYPLISHIYFNGATAEQTFRKQAAPILAGVNLQLLRLPSTSPAHAALNFQRKLECWRQITVYL